MSPIQTNQDIVWVLICSGMVLLMQGGFTCLESGLVRAKNSIHVAIKNFVDFSISSTLFWLFGFGIMFGASFNGWFGTSELLFSNSQDRGLVTFFIFQLVFCGTATTIVSGAVAERMRFSGYILVSILIAGAVYPVIGHWLWAGTALNTPGIGWLAQLGFIDFAGSTVIHSTGGWVALAAVLIIGPRTGRFTEQTPIQGHNFPLATLGAFLLWFGWFGFNGGSSYGFSEETPTIFLNTVMAGTMGSLVAMVLSWIHTGQPKVESIINGSLAGLVSITASCDIMEPRVALLIGGVGACIGSYAARLLESLKIDDVIGAFPVHACAGMWGTLAVALLSNPEKWGTGLTRWEQFLVQFQGVAACMVWAFGFGYAVLWCVNKIFPLRVSQEDELKGLNITEHGASSALIDLLTTMETQQKSGEFSNPVSVEPHTEVGQIAGQYNRVLEKVVASELEQKETAELHQLLSKTIVIANEAYSFEKAMQACLNSIRQMAGWPIGHMYMVSESGDCLESTGIWSLEDPNRFSKFQTTTEVTKFEKGIGLPGRVWEKGKPVWIEDVYKDSNFPRVKLLGPEAGVHGAFGFPVFVKNNVVAVLEFFSEIPESPNNKILDLVKVIGIQIGRIIERWENETELIEKKESAEQANKTKSMFLANMSHEIRTPLNAVLGYAQILLRKKHLDEETRNSIKVIDNSGQNLLELINQILEISKIEAGKMDIVSREFDLYKMMTQLSALFEARCQGKNLEWVVEGIQESVFVEGDEAKLRQVLTNLLGNAVKFTNSGKITFSIHCIGEDQFHFGVRDTGMGISPEDQASIFDSFQQGDAGNKMGGTGLGLAIIKKHLELFGSELKLESSENQGSYFHFVLKLPVTRTPIIQNVPSQRKVAHLAPGFNITALVVDDVPGNRNVLTGMMNDIGVETIEACDGKEAVDKVREYRPHIVFMDMRMPVMRGEEAISLIRKEHGSDQVKIIGITASAMDRNCDYYIGIGCDDYISKPFRESDLFDCLREQLNLEYVYEDDIKAEKESTNGDQNINWSELKLPEMFHSKLRDSAELSNITVLERQLADLENIKGVSKQLITHLKKLTDRYDMESILKILDTVSTH